jgi:hypothetical protein
LAHCTIVLINLNRKSDPMMLIAIIWLLSLAYLIEEIAAAPLVDADW